MLKGRGADVVTFDKPVDLPAIATMVHSGTSNFAVWTVSEVGQQTDLLVNTIGKYRGTRLFDVATDPTVAFSVEADGAWQITVEPITSAAQWGGAPTYTKTGDDVVILNPPVSGFTTATFTHTGDANFAVWGYAGSTRDLLVNEIGSYSGEVLLVDGTVLIEVTADGTWTVTLD